MTPCIRHFVLPICLSLSLVTAPRAEKTSAAKAPLAGAWSALGSGITGAAVSELGVYGSLIIAGGQFTQAGGQPASNIAAWDGTAWLPLGSGLNGAVSSIAVHSGQLVVGGSFTDAGGVAVNHLATWDGTTWAPLAPPTNAIPAHLASYDGRLFCATNTTIGTQQNPIARLDAWNGTSWQGIASYSPGSSPSNVSIEVLDVAAGRLYIGGNLASQWVFAYDGTTHSPQGSGPTWAFAFAEFAGDAYVGGFAPMIGKWLGGTSWSFNIGGSVDWEVSAAYDMTAYRDVLVVAGGLSSFVDPPNQYLLTWDGTAWSTLGTGVNGVIHALAVKDDRLYAAGQFTTADGHPASLIAQWSESPLPTKAMTWGAFKSLYQGKRR